jgi:heavy metal sensor kinase
MHLSIRARLTFWYTGILAATLLLLAGVAYGLLMRGLWHDVDNTLHSVARTLAQTAQSSAEFFPSDMDEVLRRFFGPSLADKFYQFLDPRGRLDPRWPHFRGQSFQVSAKALANAREGYATFETLEGPGPYPTRVLTFPVVARGRMVNVLQVGMSLEALEMARRHFLWAVAALMPVGLLLAGGGGWLLARRALRPVDQMTRAARRIEAEHLAQRLEGAEVNDELGRLAQTLNEMLARLEAGFAQVRRFSADASHELRTPLTVLKGEIEVALRNPRGADEYRRVLASTLEEVERMARLVDELLLLSRADAGALRWESEPVELDRLVEEATKQADVLARPKRIGVTLTEVAPLIVRGDGQRLKQLLLNLVDNAIKYTPDGGQVTLSLRATGRPPSDPAASGAEEWAEIGVRDTGVGIPPEELPRIFERFYRADAARSREAGGAGLGLCIGKTIAEAHGGRIEVESRVHAGSTFRVFLPLSA